MSVLSRTDRSSAFWPHRLREEANAHHAAAAAAAQEASALKRGRWEHALRAEQLGAFRSAMGDSLLFGMVRCSSRLIQVSESPITNPVATQA